MKNDWLSRALEESRARGFLGPNDIEPHIVHARCFAQVWQGISPTPPLRYLDLGSGGGLPGLVLAQIWGPGGVLMDAMAKRTTFLREVLKWDGAPSEIQVVTGRAEELARETSLELNFNLVTARSFGPPAVTAECAARFLQVGGYLIVSEPPNSDGKRWDSNGLAKLGLRTRELVHWEGSGFQILEKVEETGPDFPRGNGIPARKPLF